MRNDRELRAQLAERLRALKDLGVTELWIPRREGLRSSPGPVSTDRGQEPASETALTGGPVAVFGASFAPASANPAARADVRALDAEPLSSRTRPAERGLPGLSADEEFDPPRHAPKESRGEGESTVLLETLRREEIGDCTRCKLSAKRRTIVFGSGNPDANLMFVGEGPGADEDEQGLPFVGRAGQLLTKMIESMVVGGRKLRRDEVYIANIIKCRPPGNRDPEPEEIASCEGFLFEQIAIIQPRVIVALGAFAARTLLRSKAPISALRGRFHEYRGTLLMPTFHPAYILRNYTEETRRTVYEDLKKAAAELVRLPGA